jgi:BASS family bile acid:Na+ symporter
MKAGLVEIVKVMLAVLIPLTAFTVGLRAPRRADGAPPLWKQRSLLLRSLLAVLVLVPLWALALVSVLSLSPVVKGGVLVAVVAVGIGPVSEMKRIHGDAPDARYELDLNLVVLLLSIAFVPLAFSWLASLHRVPVDIGPGAVAEVVLGRAFVPMVAGLLVARLAPRFARVAGGYLPTIENAALLVVMAVILIGTWRSLLSVGVTGWLASALTAAGGVVIGHVLGGPRPGARRVLAAASALRFPALALLLATRLPRGHQIVPVVFAYVVAALVVVTGYGIVMGGRERRRRGREGAVAMPPPHGAPSAAA